VALALFQLENGIIDRAFIGGITNLARAGGKAFRYLQNGIVQTYALVFVLGSMLLFLFLMKSYALIFVLSAVPLLLFLILV
jgi:hypothetical protein